MRDETKIWLSYFQPKSEETNLLQRVHLGGDRLVAVTGYNHSAGAEFCRSFQWHAKQ